MTYQICHSSQACARAARELLRIKMQTTNCSRRDVHTGTVQFVVIPACRFIAVGWELFVNYFRCIALTQDCDVGLYCDGNRGSDTSLVKRRLIPVSLRSGGVENPKRTKGMGE
jgi:hypothetical protein